jgi:very-short-patch-repair endonuclease
VASSPLAQSVSFSDTNKIRIQLRRWQERLLDLTRSNPLLSLNRSRVSKLKTTSPSAVEIFEKLVLEEAELRMPLVRKGRKTALPLFYGDQEEQLLQVEPGDLEFEATPLDLMRRLRRIYDNGRTTVEERGVTTLFVTFGTLKWEDDRLEESISPLWMVPCRFTSKGPNAALRLSMADEETRVNPALDLYLRELHRVGLPETDEELNLESLPKFLRGVEDAVREQRWQVTDEVWLSTFSFESLVIYEDLNKMADIATTNQIVLTFAQAARLGEISECLREDLDSLPAPEVVPIPILPTDSSQLEALTYVAAGRDLVMHGPPGTGKSQTISNLIADAIGRGKKVLFVSAKMAALNIVYDRLARKGLGRFCLEAHSTKAGKSKVIDELRHTLEAEGNEDPGNLPEELQRLISVRNRLNEYVRELHRKILPLEITTYQAVGKVAGLHKLPDVRASLPWSDVLRVTRAELDKSLDALTDLGALADIFNKRKDHPWRGFRPEGGSVVQQEAVERDLREISESTVTMSKYLGKLASLISPSDNLSIHEADLFKFALGSLSKTERLPDDWWNAPVNELQRVAEFYQEAAAKVREFQSKLNQYRKYFDLPLAEVSSLLAPLESDFAAWYRVILPSYWRWRSKVQRNLKPSSRVSLTLLRGCHSLTKGLVELETWLWQKKIGTAASAETLEGTAAEFGAARLLKRALQATGRQPEEGVTCLSQEIRTAANGLLSELPFARPPFGDAIKRIDSFWREGLVDGLRVNQAPLPSLRVRVSEVLANVSKMHEWLRLQRVLDRCAELGLSPFVNQLGKIDKELPRQAFERRFYSLWADAAMQKSNVLAQFSGAQRQELLDRFLSLDEKIRRLAVKRVQATASGPVDRILKSKADLGLVGEVAILRHELQKKKRIKPLRKLFAEIPHVLQALKPCMLMSPVSVSTFLKPGSCEFDLVVFDEASQLPTAEAIPSILRARQVIVAGDSKQLPPTSFFEASVFEEGEELVEDQQRGVEPLESLLDDCVAVVPIFQEASLRWHYRSRDERLIKFSNNYFYDNRLVTFPSASTAMEGRGVHLAYVPEGVWDRGKSRTNKAEARKVAELVVQHLERFPDRSLGVVAMNANQREAIEDTISEQLQDRPNLLPLLDSGEEPFFVKALENVQGDERDAMIISVGYGKDADGHLALNFGPLNMEGGWRRLNVLVTRAKWQTTLVTSMRSHELAGINPQNRGAVALKTFIEYAERSCELPHPPPALTGAETNDFEDAVCQALRERGLQVDQQVGASKFRIDLAIRDRRDPSRYILGVECDGRTYHSSRTARDRDLLREQILMQMGWTIHRVWSTDWFREREAAVEAILQRLERAEATPPEQLVEAPIPSAPNGQSMEVGQEAQPPRQRVGRRYPPGQPYQKFRAHSRWRDAGILLKPSNVPLLATLVAEIVEKEGPIHERLIVERLKETYGIDEIARESNTAANITKAIDLAVQDRGLKRGRTGWFLFKGGDSPAGFRVPADGVFRPLDLVPPEEIEAAILHLVEDQFGLMRDRIPRVVGLVLGIKRVTAEAAGIIDRAVDDLVERRLLCISGWNAYLC